MKLVREKGKGKAKGEGMKREGVKGEGVKKGEGRKVKQSYRK